MVEMLVIDRVEKHSTEKLTLPAKEEVYASRMEGGSSDEYLSREATTRSLQGPVGAHAAPPVLKAGDLLEERFEIIQFLARGGMGEVYEAADRQMQGKHLALKTLRLEGAGDSLMRQRFVREALLAREILHPNVCPTYDLFHSERSQEPLMFLTMKLLRGESLSARLNRSGAMPPEVALPIVTQIGAALDAAHKAGVIHRDFKPGNVMLEATASGSHVYITDFGLSRACEADGTLAQTGRISGTLGYIAPELLQGRIASPASDVYAFGVVLHEMLTGRRPEYKPGRTDFVRPSSLMPGLPRSWDRVVLGCLAYDPAQRFQSAGEALQALSGTSSSRRSAAFRAPVSRRWFIAPLAAVAVLAAAAAWLEWPRIEDLLHPLPAQRFVAVMAWPADTSSPLHSLLEGVLNGITLQFARAESGDRNLLVLTPSDARQGVPKTLPEAVTSMGANLVLGAQLRQQSPRYLLDLRVYDASNGKVFRTRELTVAAAKLSRLSEMAAEAAALLLDVKLSAVPRREQDELAHLASEQYRLFQEGVDLVSQPNDSGLDQAIEKFQKTLDAVPHFSLGYATLALAYCRKYMQNQDAALANLATKNAALAMQYNPDSVHSIFASALAQVLSGQPERGLSGIEKAMRLDPGNPQFAAMKALALRDLGRNEEAAAVYRDIIRARPNFWPASNDLGYLLSRQTREIDYQRAAEAFAEAAAMAPKVALPLANEGSMYLLMHQQEKAELLFRESLRRAPNYTAFVNLGSILFQKKDYRQALDYYSQARDLRPQNHILWRNLGDCYSVLGNNAQAMENYKMAAQTLAANLRNNPRNATNWVYLAFYQAKLGQKVEAASDLATAATKGDITTYGKLMKAQALVLLGHKDEAVQLVIDCFDHGISSVDVELALDLKEVREDPRYRQRIAQNTAQ